MKVTQVALRPTEASIKAGRPSLTPELLASVGARYSRNNEGLEAIISKIDFGNEEETLQAIRDIYNGVDRENHTGPQRLALIKDALANERPANLDKGVDAIFNMLDYGHQSIADMTPVAMFMDGVSIFAAYYLWSIAPVAGGQESSTRYIKMSIDGLIDPDLLGIPADQQENWKAKMAKAFEFYQEKTAFWEQLSQQHPELMRIPQSLLDSEDEKDKKKVDRMRRNYAFDRARVLIPVGCATNVMMIQSARAWATMITNLLSHPLKELNTLGKMLLEELSYAAPRLVKHARFNEATHAVLTDEMWSYGPAAQLIQDQYLCDFEGESKTSVEPASCVDVLEPTCSALSFEQGLKHRTNRYSLCGTHVARTFVSFSWDAVALAEIRDLNRHRTGTKYCPLYPVGFYAAEDQVPAESTFEDATKIVEYANFGMECVGESRQQYLASDPSYIYWCLLGTQFPFEHITTADKFIYEAELRTGLGAHYRYAKHLRDALELFYQAVPESRGLIKEGTAEPE